MVSGPHTRARTTLAVLFAGLTLLIGASSIAAPSPQAMKRARAAYKQGKAAFELGRFDDALSSYEKAYEIAALPGLLFNIGQCYRNLGQLEKAAFSFRLYLRKLPTAPNKASVRILINELETRLAQRRAEAQRQRALAAERKRREAEERRLRLERRRRELTENPPVAPSKPVYAKWWFWTAVGVAVAGGVAAVYFGTQGGTDLPSSPFPKWTIP